MKRCRGSRESLLSVFVSMVVALLLAACSGGGGDTPSSTSSGGTTTVSGKVTISSTTSGTTTGLKARPKATMAPQLEANAKGRPLGKTMKGSPSMPGNRLAKVIQSAASQAPSFAAGAGVSLYDADHPEWLYPVATATTVADGSYTLSTLTNASKNNNAYTDGADIPAGNYTLVAIGQEYSTSAVTTTEYPLYDTAAGKAYRLVVGIQSTVNHFSATGETADLVVQSSDATPSVMSIMGKKTADLTTNATGAYDLGTVAANQALQVTFSMAMHRVNTPGAITVKDASGNAVAGDWKMNPDLTVATFYPASPMTENANYKVAVSSTATANYYGKGLKNDVNAVFTAGVADTTPPNAILVSPDAATGVDIATAIKIAATEPMDVNTITVTSTPSIGAMPTIKSLGYKNVTGQYDYGYQIVPSAALQLNTDYAITVSGGKDLAGNAMTSVTFNFKTAATSTGVDAASATATQQTDVKGTVTKWVEAMNAGDAALFGSMLTGDFNFTYSTAGQTTCSIDSPCSYDLNRDGSLSYDEFLNFIAAWFNQNSAIPNWTGDAAGVHIVGDVAAGTTINVDVSTGTAAFAFVMNYVDASGVVDANKSITLYLTLKDVNGAWYVSGISERDNTGAVGANVGFITTGTPNSLQPMGTRTVTFNWTAVTGAASYAVILTDNNDPTGSTGWVGIVDGSGTAALDFSSVLDVDATDGTISLVGGTMNAPFARELKLQDGGSYTWEVIAFKTLTASSFTGALAVDPAADMMAVSNFVAFSIDGVLATTLTVTPKTPGGVNLSYDDALYAWKAGTDSSVTLEITPSTAASTGGKVYVYGTNYAEKAFTFANGKATITVDLFNGYNWIDVTDGVNWWYATTNQTHGATASNYIYTTGGVSYNLLSVNSVSAGGAVLAMDTYGYYNLGATSTATQVTISGSASAGTVYVYNSSDTGYSANTSASVAGGSYAAVVDIYSGYNWISIYDGYGNWAYVNIYNAGGGAVYVSPISNVTVNGFGPDWVGGSYYTVNTNSNVTISGNFANANNGYWYKWSNVASASGTLFNTNGTFSFSILADPGDNWFDLYDANWNWTGITVYNSAAPVQPNTITSIGGTAVAPQPYYYSFDAGNSCSLAINGVSPASANGPVYVYLYSYDSLSGTSMSGSQTVYADMFGNYSINQSIYAGTNYVDIYDTNWNWQQVVATTTGCAPVVFGVNSVAGATWDAYNYYWDAGTATAVTVNGTGATPNATVTAYVSGLYYTTVTTVSDASGNFSFTNLPIYNGYNWLSVTDGWNWTYPTIYTTGQAAYTPPVNSVLVDGVAASSGGTVSDSWGTWYTAASTVTVSGAVTTGDGLGWFDVSGPTTYTGGQLSIVGGSFTQTVSLEYGWNYIYLYDANWNMYSVSVYTTGGLNAPVKVVTVTSPGQGTTVTGAVTVTATIDTAVMTPSLMTASGYVYAYVYDYVTGSWINGYWDGVTPDATIISWGYVPITYDVATGAAAFPATVNGYDQTMIEVYAWDAVSGISHGNDVYVNNTYGYTEYFWKPGAKASSKSAKERAHQMEFKRKMMSHQAKTKAKR